MKFVLNFLAYLFKEGLEYSTINSHRSAISAYHCHVDSIPVGQHPQICSLLTGVFNLKPPQPKYTFIWDVQKVLTDMNSLPENEHLSVLLLSQKLATLLALTAASRCSEICILDTRYMVQGETYYRFHFSKLFKSWRKGKPAPSIEYSSYFENNKLCVVKALNQYLKVSDPWREDTKKF